MICSYHLDKFFPESNIGHRSNKYSHPEQARATPLGGAEGASKCDVQCRPVTEGDILNYGSLINI